MSLEDAMLIAGLEKREGFRVSYLKVLKDSGLISLTIPDRINDPNQKYIISERGKKLLGGMEI